MATKVCRLHTLVLEYFLYKKGKFSSTLHRHIGFLENICLKTLLLLECWCGYRETSSPAGHVGGKPLYLNIFSFKLHFYLLYSEARRTYREAVALDGSLFYFF